MLAVNRLDESDLMVGTKVEESIHILADGTLIDGGFNRGIRGVEHREIDQLTKLNRYDSEAFWAEVTVEMGLVLVLPETKTIMVNPRHTVTNAQQKRINEAVCIGFLVGELS